MTSLPRQRGCPGPSQRDTSAWKPSWTPTIWGVFWRVHFPSLARLQFNLTRQQLRNPDGLFVLTQHWGATIFLNFQTHHKDTEQGVQSWLLPTLKTQCSILNSSSFLFFCVPPTLSLSSHHPPPSLLHMLTKLLFNSPSPLSPLDFTHTVPSTQNTLLCFFQVNSILSLHVLL